MIHQPHLIRADMRAAFVNGRGYNLDAEELEAIYLALIRLEELELFGTARDWEAVAAYCPRAEDDAEDIAKTLHLNLTFHWFEETTSGRKRVEYRTMTKPDGSPSRWVKDILERRDQIAFVRFARGYTSTTRTYRVTNIDIGPCPIPDWAGDYIRIHFEDFPEAAP